MAGRKGDLAPYVIQLVPGPADDLEEIIELLKRSGVELDGDYGIVAVGNDECRFVTRALVPTDHLADISQDERVTLFPDIGLRPTDQNGTSEREEQDHPEDRAS